MGEALHPLALEDELVVVMRDELFGGSWARMEQDLRERQVWCHPNEEVNRVVERELARIARLRALEGRNGGSLCGLLSLRSVPGK